MKIEYTPSLNEQAKENPLARLLKKDLQEVNLRTSLGVYTLTLDKKSYCGESLRECQEVLSCWKQGKEPEFSIKQALQWRKEEFGI
jgi:hypothetical protein